MPPRTLPTREELGAAWKNELKPRKFFLTEGLQHFYRSVQGVKAVPPSFRFGAELGFGFRHRDLTVIGWTSYVPSLRTTRLHDKGWVVIEQDGEAVYFVPLNRTKNFVHDLVCELRIARCRIMNRPICPVCGEGMKIVRGKHLGSRRWLCSARHAKADWDNKEFLLALPADLKEYLDERRRSRKRNQDNQKAAGKEIRQAMLRRKHWRKMRAPIAEF